MSSRYLRARILYRYLGMQAVAGQVHANFAPFLGMLEGVVQQIGQSAAEQRSLYRGMGLPHHPHRHTGLVKQQFHEFQGLGDFGGQGHLFHVTGTLALLGPRQEQHVGHDGAEAFQLFQVRLQHLAQPGTVAFARQGHLRQPD